MVNEENNLEDIKVDEPVEFDSEKESENKFYKEHAMPYDRVGLEPIEPINSRHKSTLGTKISFVLLMLFSAAVGAYFVWALMF